MPLIGDVPARDATTDELADRIEAKLATSYLRDPNVTVEVATYRPFFVLGEVGESGPVHLRARDDRRDGDRRRRRLHRPRQPARRAGQPHRSTAQLYEDRMPVTEPIRPGDTIYVFESLF